MPKGSRENYRLRPERARVKREGENMTRKKFFRLRTELVIRINRKYGGQSIGKAMYQCRDIRPAIHNYEGYAGVWESLKPARDLVGM